MPAVATGNRLRVIATLLLTSLVLSACGTSDDGSGASGPNAGGPNAQDPGPAAEGTAGGVQAPCDLTEPAVVAEVFGGSVASEEAGQARNCMYDVTDGAADQVSVYYFGTRGEWAGIRGGYESNRGPLIDVAGLGDEAFHPGDVKEWEIVVLAGDVAFAVGLYGSPSATKPEAPAKLRELAQHIAGSLT